MPRPLPWNTKPESNATTSRPNPPAVTSTSTNPSISSRPTKRARTFPPKNDPPPTTGEGLTNLTGMLPGDDTWIMVEDEFLSTAHLFTKSLHEAEYEKLSAAAKEKHSQRISRLQGSSQATPQSRDLLRKREDAARERQKRIEEEEEALDCESELGMLMRGGGKGRGVSLVGMGGRAGRVVTRAAVGFTEGSGCSQSQARRAGLDRGASFMGMCDGRAGKPTATTTSYRLAARMMPPFHHLAPGKSSFEYDDDLDLDEVELPVPRRRSTADTVTSHHQPSKSTSSSTSTSTSSSKTPKPPHLPSSTSTSSQSRHTPSFTSPLSSFTSTYSQSTQSTSTTTSATQLDSFPFGSFDFTLPPSRFRGKSAARRYRALAGSSGNTAAGAGGEEAVVVGEKREVGEVGEERRKKEADVMKVLMGT
ncbi:hypothetical protein EX30DRAFT_393967 [Ascodesmis nigricans]|uniref:Uncharacterized protein n=1 Tax=Ascodesmis nigricans TaxID=341454 RepID=A0A4S2N0Y3_9PEZI|nr:hypothetical protein EX30DRAFT_393967 [Ascodesmis nigricans]